MVQITTPAADVQQKADKRTLRTEPSPEYRTRRGGEAPDGSAAEPADSSSAAVHASAPEQARSKQLSTAHAADGQGHAQQAHAAAAYVQRAASIPEPASVSHACSRAPSGVDATAHAGRGAMEDPPRTLDASHPQGTTVGRSSLDAHGASSAVSERGALNETSRRDRGLQRAVQPLRDSTLLRFLEARCQTLRGGSRVGCSESALAF